MKFLDFLGRRQSSHVSDKVNSNGSARPSLTEGTHPQKPVTGLQKQSLTSEDHNITQSVQVNARLTAPVQPQLQSSLLSVLPLELRQRIFEEILANQTIHIDYELDNNTQQWQWFQCICEHPPDYPIWWQDHCRAYELNTGNHLGMNISLLFTCLQIYNEAVSILYSRNTFRISTPTTILALPQLLPSTHLTSITSLELIWFFEPQALPIHSSSSFIQYESVWTSISTFYSLKSLKVAICTSALLPQKTSAKNFDDKWLDPVEAMVQVWAERHVKVDFVLDMPERLVAKFRKGKSQRLTGVVRPYWEQVLKCVMT